MTAAKASWQHALLLLLGGMAQTTAANAGTMPELPRQGWVSWDIETVADAPAWCCMDWRAGRAERRICKLDSPNHGYGSDDRDAKVSSMRVFAHFDAGKLDRLRTLATTCPVQTKTPVRDLGVVSEDASLQWLGGVVSPHTGHSDDALAALAVHRGDAATQALTRIARSDSHLENRKQALFWATQVRGDVGLQLTLPFLFDDPDPKLREHAAFAVAQTRAPKAVAALIRQGREDAATQVRSQAWFWLVQTGAANAEASIRDALPRETSPQVRDQAVFALSQLPEPRNVLALVRVAEDRALGRGERKQALFWLGQSESAEALKYLDRLLLGSADAK